MRCLGLVDAQCSIKVGCCELGAKGLVLVEHCSVCCVQQGTVGDALADGCCTAHSRPFKSN